MNRSPSVHRLALSCLAALCLGVTASASAQVTFFDKPPSPDQLRDALKRAPAASPAPGQPRSRGSVWDQPGGQAGQQQQAAIAAEPPRAGAAPADAPAGDQGPAAAFPINFDVGSAKVLPQSMGYIDAIASVMARDPSIRLVIEGHTDVTGAYQRNMMLSWERAYSVFKLLVERYGIDPARLQPIGRGPLEPMPGVAPNDGMNRRVQFRVAG
jgi:outer membrane protein OmpA-like peptidoglycan-associated protein